MIETLAPPKPVPGSLLARLIALARLSERVGRIEPRGVLLDKMVRRVLLFSRMTERLGIAAPESPLMRAVLREAELGCLECTAWRQCRRWLDGRSPDEDYSDFCPNEGLFGVLPRQDSVRHPYAPE
jgi:Family of unknown function (DUF6455)